MSGGDSWDNQYNDPTDHSSGPLGCELVDGEWKPLPDYKRMNRFAGDMAYGPPS